MSSMPIMHQSQDTDDHNLMMVMKIPEGNYLDHSYINA